MKHLVCFLLQNKMAIQFNAIFTQTLIWYLCATSSSKGTILSVGSPFSSFVFGGYQERARTPENYRKFDYFQKAQ